MKKPLELQDKICAKLILFQCRLMSDFPKSSKSSGSWRRWLAKQRKEMNTTSLLF
jgi:hypothetical protein